MAALTAAIPASAKQGPNPPLPASASGLPKTNAPASVLNTTDNAHASKSEAGKPHKDGLKSSKENVKGAIEEVAKATTDNHSHGLRSLSASSGDSKIVVRRCLSKVMRNIEAAGDYPVRTRKPKVSRRVLPPAPNPYRTKINPAKNSNVRLICRIQPTTYYASDRIIIHPGNQVVEVLQPNKLNPQESSRWMFNFDHIFYGGSQEEVYHETFEPALNKALSGINSLILLSGRKGTGKTYTSCGEDNNFDYRGMIPRALHRVFDEIRSRHHESDIRVSISYFDLVGETILDLLSERFVDVMTECTYHNLTYVKELAYARPTNEEEALVMYFLANYGRTRMLKNYKGVPIEYSTFFTVYFEIHSKTLTEDIFTVSKLTFLELGSTTNLRDVPRVLPSTHNVLLAVNKSISLLEKAMSMKLTGEVPVDKIPCRQSKLVYALKDILTKENSLITVLVCMSGEAENLDQSISSLRFSSRFKGIFVRSAPNQKVDRLAAYRKKVEEADMLRTELRMYDLLNSRESPEYALHVGAQDYFRSARDVRDYMDGRINMPKFSTYKQLENFLQLMKKHAKDGDLPMEPADIPDSLPGTRDVNQLSNEGEDGKNSPQSNPFDTEGVGELDDKEGVGIGATPSGTKWKGVKGLLKKKKLVKQEEKDEKAKTEKPSVSNAKKLGSDKQSGKNRGGQSPLTTASDSNVRTESTLPRPGTPKEEGLAASSKPVPQVPSEAKLSVLGVPPFLSAGKSAQAGNTIQQPVTKAEGYAFFTTKYPNGTETAKTVETQRQMAAVKEKTALSLATGINLWIEEMEIESSKLANLVLTRSRTCTKSTAEIPIVTFEEYKLRSSVQHLQYLIETGRADLKLCKSDLATLHHDLNESRKKLLSAFDEWFVRTCVESPGAREKCASTVPVSTLGVPSSVPGSSGTTRPVTPPQSLVPITGVPAKRESVQIGLTDISKVDKSVLSNGFKIAPKDALERHQAEKQILRAAENLSPEAAFYEEIRQKVKKIVKIREENEAHDALNPGRRKRKLDPELTLRKITTDLPTALRNPHL